MIGWNRQTHRLAVSVYFLSITQRERMATISKPSWQMSLNVTYVFILSPSFRRVTEPPDGIPYTYILTNICSQVKNLHREARRESLISLRAFFATFIFRLSNFFGGTRTKSCPLQKAILTSCRCCKKIKEATIFTTSHLFQSFWRPSHKYHVVQILKV